MPQRQKFGWLSRGTARVLITLQASVGLPPITARALASETPDTLSTNTVTADAEPQDVQVASAEKPPAAAKAKPPATPPPPPKVNVNRKAPKVAPVPPRPIFPSQPKDEDFFRQRVFGEPLVPIGGDTSSEENQALAEALNRYFDVRDKEDAEAPTTFLEAHPNSPWRASLLLNLGTVYRGHGRFTRAIDAWKQAWDISKTALDPWGRAVADGAIGELADLHKQLGHMRELQEILEEVEGRELRGSAGIKMQYAREGENVLRTQHDMALPTGPIALDRILEATDPNYKGMPKELVGVHAKPEGFTLSETVDLAGKVGLKLQMAFRESGEIPLPSVVHLKVDRFTAVTRMEDGKYRVEDPALPLWMSLDGLANETTGYFLIPEGAIPEGWRKVGREEGDKTHNNCMPGGRGFDGPTCESPGGGGDSDCSGSCAMAQYDLHLLEASLHVYDSPVGYTPPRGPAVRFRLDYNQAEGNQPGIFTFSNVGLKWTHGWLSYVVDNPTNLSAAVTVFQRGGGIERFATFDPSTQSYEPHVQSRAVLVRTATSPIQYERRLPDGSKAVFGQPDGVSTYPRRVFLTQFVDPQGNSVSFTYDASLRLVAVTDAISQVTTLSYENPTDPLKITKVTDPFGRFATLTYNDAGQLTSITDVIGITSSFDYEAQDFMHSMTTPYGTTTFTTAGVSAGGNGTWVEATDPVGGRERVEYFTVSSLPAADNPATVPQGMMTQPSSTSMLNLYISVYWDKRQIAYYPDQTKGTSTRWELSVNPQFSGQVVPIKFSEKRPLENKVWYEYPGQTVNYVSGTHAQPSAIGRVLDDGTSQIYRYEYNSKGKTTRYTDPIGRTTIFNYASNGIDLTEVRQANGQTTDLLQSATYNSQHQPLTKTDASLQTTTYTFNAQGQLLTIVTPPRSGLALAQRTTTLIYDANGYVQSATGPATGATTSYTYDGYGRIRSLTTADNHTTTYDHDVLDRPTRATYPDGTYEESIYNRLDAEKSRDRFGRWTHTLYDALRRVVVTRDPLGRTTTQQWCSCGSLDKIIDPNGNATTWERDLQGRATRELEADGAGNEYIYENTTSRVKQFKDPKNQTRTYEYFLDNSLKKVTYTNAVVPTPAVSLTYEPAYRRLATVTDGTGTTVFAYHPITTSPQPGAGERASVDGPLAGESDKITYGYDELGQVVRREINGTANVATQAFDLLYRPTNETNALGSFTYAYQGITGRLASIAYPNGQTTVFDYLDNLGDRRLKEVHHKRPGGATLSKFGYATSALGLVSSLTQEVDAAAATSYEYGRDSADQLTAAVLKSTGPTPSTLKSYAYGYDQAGNRTAEAIDSTVVSSSYNNVNEPLQQQGGGALRFGGTVSEPAGVTVAGAPAQVSSTNSFEGTTSVATGTNPVAVVATDPSGNVRTNTYQVNVGGIAKTFAHDANGNLTSDGTRSFEWDAEDRPVAVVQGTLRSEFTYNGLGQRVRIVEKDGAAVLSDRRYVWCDLSVCEERDGTGSSVLRRFFHQGVQEGSEAYFYTRDHLGSIREMSDSTGTLRARYDYDPFGRQTKLSGDKDAALGFTGHFRHSPSSLELAPYRAYDASIGRWTSKDPIGFSTADLNLYAYVANGPVDWVDPTGQFVFVGVIFTPPGLAALGAAAEATLFVATAVAAGIGLAEMTSKKNPPKALPPTAPNPKNPPVTGPSPKPAPPPPPVTIPTTRVPNNRIPDCGPDGGGNSDDPCVAASMCFAMKSVTPQCLVFYFLCWLQILAQILGGGGI